MVSKWIKGGKAAWGAIVGVKPRTTPSHALKKFKARIEGIEEGIKSSTKSAKKAKILPKKKIEEISKKVKLEQKSETGKKLLKENQ
jgi:hypothetical protein